MTEKGMLRQLDAVTVPVPSLEEGLAFYRDVLGHRLAWRNDSIGAVALELPEGDSELVLTTEQAYEPNWLVDDLDVCLETFVGHGGSVVAPPTPIPVGRVAVVADPFGNALVLVELSTGRYQTDHRGRVTGVGPTPV